MTRRSTGLDYSSWASRTFSRAPYSDFGVSDTVISLGMHQCLHGGAGPPHKPGNRHVRALRAVWRSVM